MKTRGDRAVLSAYIDLVVGGDSTVVKHADIAKRVNERNEGAKMSGPLIGRWRRGEVDPSGGNLSAFAYAYGRNPVEAYVAAGTLDLAHAAGALDAESRNLLASLGIGRKPKSTPPAKATKGA